MPLARRVLRRKTLQNLGVVVNGIGLLDKHVVCIRDHYAVGIRALNGRLHAVQWRTYQWYTRSKRDHRKWMHEIVCTDQDQDQEQGRSTNKLRRWYIKMGYRNDVGRDRVTEEASA